MSFEKLHEYLANTVPCDVIPGCDILVYHKGELVYREQFGYGDYFKTKPVNIEEHYILYSCSKVVTCSAVLHLYEEGKLGLDDPVSKYLPAFAEVTLKDGSRPKTEMTVRHLFTMSSGLNYDLNTLAIRETLRQNPDADTVTLANAIAKTPLEFEPGTHYRYSLSHDILAAIAEVITGKNFEEYVNEWIFRPLGLTEIAYNFNENNRKKLIPQYMTSNGNASLVAIGADNPYIFSKNYYSGGAGIIGRAEDYTKILSALSQGKLLKKETLDLMKTNQLDEVRLQDLRKTPWLKAYGYGLGVRTLTDPEQINHTAPVGEFGWDGAAGSFALVDSDREIAIGYFQQVRNCQYAYNVVHPTIRALVYEALGYTFK